MNWMLIIGIFIVIVIVVIFIWWHNSATVSTHSITLRDGTKVYQSPNVILNTSDSVSLIYYVAPTGIYAYDINLKTTTLISSMTAKGLAYSNGLLVLDMNGNVFNLNVSSSTPIASDITALYSTVGGYAFSNVSGTFDTSSLTLANGNFGLVQYTVV